MPWLGVHRGMQYVLGFHFLVNSATYYFGVTRIEHRRKRYMLRVWEQSAPRLTILIDVGFPERLVSTSEVETIRVVWIH